MKINKNLIVILERKMINITNMNIIDILFLNYKY